LKGRVKASRETFLDRIKQFDVSRKQARSELRDSNPLYSPSYHKACTEAVIQQQLLCVRAHTQPIKLTIFIAGCYLQILKCDSVCPAWSKGERGLFSNPARI